MSRRFCLIMALSLAAIPFVARDAPRASASDSELGGRQRLAVANAGFELKPSGRSFTPSEPVSGDWGVWCQGSSSFAVDREVAHTGGTSGRISTAPDVGVWVQTLPAQPGLQYIVEAYVKTQEAEMAYLSLRWKDAQSRWINTPHYASADLSGTNEWTRLSVRETAPPNAGHLAILLGLRRSPNGVAWFDDVVCWQASAPRLASEPIRRSLSFNDLPAGPAPADCRVAAGKGCSVAVADVPTWVYDDRGERFVPDPCLALTDDNEQPGQTASVAFAFPPMPLGMVEFDVMADQYEGEALRVRLGDGPALVVDKEGAFHYQSGDKRMPLLRKVGFPHVAADARFGLQARRWYTLRLSFDCDAAILDVAVVRLYNASANLSEDEPTPNFLPLGNDLPLSPAPLGKPRSSSSRPSIQQVSIQTGGKGRIYVDNVFVINRTTDLAGDAWRAPAAQIMKASFPPRKDPIHIHEYSLRNTLRNAKTGKELNDLRAGRKGAFIECAMSYNRALIAQAFLAERLREAERQCFCLRDFPGLRPPEIASRLDSAQSLVADTERRLNDLYQFYASCYLDALNETALREGFKPRHTRFQQDLDQARSTLDALARATADHARTLVPAFTPLAPKAPSTAKPSFSNGTFRRDGEPTFLLAHQAGLYWPEMERMLELDGCGAFILNASWTAGTPAKPGFFDPAALNRSFQSRVLSRSAGETAYGILPFGLHSCSSPAPAWWIQKHKADPDIFLRNADGQADAQNPDESGCFPLNYWHPEVLKLADEACFQQASHLHRQFPGRVLFHEFMQEPAHRLSNGGETGYNPTAVAAFRTHLQKTYGAIEALNARWRTNYGAFDQISPPPDGASRATPRLQPSGLAYEFERFRQKGYFDWMRVCTAAVKRGQPGVPVACRLSAPFGGWDYLGGFNLVEVFRVFDIVTYHGLLRDRLMARYLDSLNRVFGKSTGILEWGVPGPDDIFNEKATRNDGLRQMFEVASWGQGVLGVWYGTLSGMYDGCNWSEPRLGHTVLRYSAAYIPLGVSQARENAQVFLACPTLEPQVAILESQTSFYNAHPVSALRAQMCALAGLLEARDHHYGYLFEDLLLEGRQTLDGCKVILLPYAVSVPDALVRQLMAWVRAGGVLIATGPAGRWSEFGASDDRLLGMTFGQMDWSFDAKSQAWTAKFAQTPPIWLEFADGAFWAGATCGKGRVFVTNSSQLGEAQKDAVYQVISREAPRPFFAQNGRLRIVARQGRDCLYLSVLNPDCYEYAEDEIAVRGTWGAAADVTAAPGFPVRVVARDGLARFRTRLAPAEGIVVRLSAREE